MQKRQKNFILLIMKKEDQDRETDLMKNWQKILEESDVFKNQHAKFNMILFVGQLMKDYETLLKSERRKAVEELVKVLEKEARYEKWGYEIVDRAQEYLKSLE